MIFHDKFKILADYGDLSKYTLVEMNGILSNWDKYVFENEQCVDATWQNKSSLITIRYELHSTKFIRIIEEEWKHLNQRFTRHPLVN